MHQFEWLSERGGNFLNFLQKEGVPRKGDVPSEKGVGGSNPGGSYGSKSEVTKNIFNLQEWHKNTRNCKS